jgi:hypothetical protein
MPQATAGTTQATVLTYYEYVAQPRNTQPSDLTSMTE